MQTTYDFYKSEYGGSLDEALFLKYEKRAKFKLNSLTFGNITDEMFEMYSEQVQYALCSIIDNMEKIDKAMNDRTDASAGGVKSMSSGGQSITFADNVYTKAVSDQTAQDALYMAGIIDYLYDTGLLYAGV